MQSPQYVWQRPGWPQLTFDVAQVASAVALAHRAQGIVEGKLSALGLQKRRELAAEAWAQEAVSTAAIEGEQLDLLAVRSSIAQRLGTATYNARQRKAVNALLDRSPGGFEGGMNTRKYVGLNSTSRATASRELIELDALGVFAQVGGGRSVRYYINLPGWVP